MSDYVYLRTDDNQIYIHSVVFAFRLTEVGMFETHECCWLSRKYGDLSLSFLFSAYSNTDKMELQRIRIISFFFIEKLFFYKTLYYNTI